MTTPIPISDLWMREPLCDFENRLRFNQEEAKRRGWTDFDVIRFIDPHVLTGYPPGATKYVRVPDFGGGET